MEVVGIEGMFPCNMNWQQICSSLNGCCLMSVTRNTCPVSHQVDRGVDSNIALKVDLSIITFSCPMLSYADKVYINGKLIMHNFQIMHKSQFSKMNTYNWFCGPVI